MRRPPRSKTGWTVLDPKGKGIAWDREREVVKEIAAAKVGHSWGTLVGLGYRLEPGRRAGQEGAPPALQKSRR